MKTCCFPDPVRLLLLSMCVVAFPSLQGIEKQQVFATAAESRTPELKSDQIDHDDHHQHHYSNESNKRSFRETKENGPFTVIFMSDLENEYRNHPKERSQYVVSYILNLKDEGLFFSGAYEDMVIDPQLVIHGGDISHMWGCDFNGICRTVEREFLDVWDAFYEANIPLISGYGNHDYWLAEGTGNQVQWPNNDIELPEQDRTSKRVNIQSSDFVRKTYEKASALGELEYIEFPPEGGIGQTMYRATFRGIQIAHFNCAVNWESYDEKKEEQIFGAEKQFQELVDSLDPTQATLFIEHYPIGALAQGQDDVEQLLWSFVADGDSRRAVHLAGHYHVAQSITYDNSEGALFQEYVAPYPHTWNGRLPGFLALLVDPEKGILQVEEIVIPGLPDGTQCKKDKNCGSCNSGYTKWHSLGEFACGQEPLLPDGSPCKLLSSCRSCENKATFWRSLWSFACGKPS